MKESDIKKILQKVRTGTLSIEKAVESLRTLPFEDIGFAHIDHHRPLRQGFPEVIWGEGKSAEQLIAIIRKMRDKKYPILATRVDKKKAAQIKKIFPEATYYPASRALTVVCGATEAKGRGMILVISAGTSDIPVAEEAVITARIMGNPVEHIYDVGVAGIHRLMSQTEKLFAANVLIVVAGMEGALPSVVGGLVSRPVIAVPTSTGYGSSFGGITALLGMLNSCASGVAVVNIDNGFGAGYVASLINQGS
ncbi:MAG: nickel pincer cofactor biosynthesis protein LarB [Proteobacteria bacterium]|nr:nickel pincer cofactor biosynthesis protein LarB [Pseudomonadota bacterium]